MLAVHFVQSPLVFILVQVSDVVVLRLSSILVSCVPICLLFFFLMIRRPPRSTLDRSSAASDVYKRQALERLTFCPGAIAPTPKGR